MLVKQIFTKHGQAISEQARVCAIFFFSYASFTIIGQPRNMVRAMFSSC